MSKIIPTNFNIANSISIMRVVLAIVLSLMIVFGSKSNLMTFFNVIVCTIACVSDYFDGYFARKFGTCSTIGAELDPAADKILIILVLIALVYRQKIIGLDIIPLFIIIARELIVSSLRATALLMEEKNEKKIGLQTSYGAKIKTTFQCITIFSFILLDFNIFSNILMFFASLSLWISCFIAIFTSFEYVKKFIKF